VLPRLRLGVEEHLPGKVRGGVGRRRPGEARDLVEVDAADLLRTWKSASVAFLMSGSSSRAMTDSKKTRPFFAVPVSSS
jgi:hypothetical protein